MTPIGNYTRAWELREAILSESTVLRQNQLALSIFVPYPTIFILTPFLFIFPPQTFDREGNIARQLSHLSRVH